LEITLTKYLNIETNQYPLHDGDLEVLIPGWTPGDALPYPWVEVQEVVQIEAQQYTTTYEGLPTLIDGKWSMTWLSRPMTDNEKAKVDAPIPRDGKDYFWDEATLSWVEVQ
jgi:hypothetical protein